MNDEVQVALKELRGGFRHAGCPDSWVECDHARALAQAYLAEHPADDDTVVDEAWVARFGKPWGNNCGAAGYFLGPLYLLFIRGVEMTVRIGAERLLLNPTRGDVRRLCRALGIKLKE